MNNKLLLVLAIVLLSFGYSFWNQNSSRVTDRMDAKSQTPGAKETTPEKQSQPLSQVENSMLSTNEANKRASTPSQTQVASVTSTPSQIQVASVTSTPSQIQVASVTSTIPTTESNPNTLPTSTIPTTVAPMRSEIPSSSTTTMTSSRGESPQDPNRVQSNPETLSTAAQPSDAQPSDAQPSDETTRSESDEPKKEDEKKPNTKPIYIDVALLPSGDQALGSVDVTLAWDPAMTQPAANKGVCQDLSSAMLFQNGRLMNGSLQVVFGYPYGVKPPMRLMRCRFQYQTNDSGGTTRPSFSARSLTVADLDGHRLNYTINQLEIQLIEQ